MRIQLATTKLVLSVLLLGGCAAYDNQSTQNTTFKSAFADDFLIGTAVSERQVMTNEKTRAFVAEQFSALTAENSMKWESLQPQEGEFNWRVADELVAFSEAHGIHVTGHTLLWHQQVPEWVFEGADGEPASRSLLLNRLRQHIHSVIGRYKGRIPSWDVVNEALNEDGSMRESQWYKLIGPDYLVHAFKFAHEADPEAKLYYNDYNLFKPEKRNGAVKLVRDIQQAGAPVHGIGLQAHYGVGYPEDLTQIEDSIIAFGELGEVLITELDVSVLPFPDEEQQGADISLNMALSDQLNPYVDGVPEQDLKKFNDHYVSLFKIFLDHKDKISRVTFWGVDDAQSWRNNWPMSGRTDYPLLVDRKQVLKPVTETIFSLAQ
ncbi:endo-1,4-beta-xylanase [Gilvimarinus polysaccharolyticus]|uniref:endo-1,4-beta-xylanase n=1 Tax=Gilvimarinus polysaccharolyticus TaxID=863921 RepID=UPI0009FD7920|nr:endo-1,4-beta-xylanase [Gilvimarinus polysaccharolyticus]